MRWGMHLQSQRGGGSPQPRHETRGGDDGQADGSQAHGRCAWSVLWRCLSAVREDGVWPAGERRRYGVCVVSRWRTLSG